MPGLASLILAATSRAHASKGLTILGTPARISVFVTGSILISAVSGTCFTHTKILKINTSLLYVKLLSYVFIREYNYAMNLQKRHYIHPTRFRMFCQDFDQLFNVPKSTRIIPKIHFSSRIIQNILYKKHRYFSFLIQKKSKLHIVYRHFAFCFFKFFQTLFLKKKHTLQRFFSYISVFFVKSRK